MSSSPPPSSSAITTSLSPQDIRNMLNHIPQDQLFEILQTAALNHSDVLVAIRDAADRDITLRKLFIRCLSAESTSETLHRIFSPFGTIQEAVVVYDRVIGRSKCYDFVTFKHVESAVVAMCNPTKRIDGRMTVTQLASAGFFNNEKKKIFMENIPFEISADTLLNHFLKYGEVEEGPIDFDYEDRGRRPRGFVFVVYKNEEAVQVAVCIPGKVINGYTVQCRLAYDHRKSNHEQNPGPTSAAASSGLPGNGMSGQVQQ